MNRTVLIGLVVVLLAAAGYYQFGYAPAQRAAEQAAVEAKAAETKAAEEAAAAAKALEDKAAEAAAAASQAATDAATAATDAASKAVDAATEAAGAATEAVGNAADMVWDATKLTAEDILARIDAAPITAEAKATLKATYESVKDNTAGVQTVLDQLKSDMGL